MPEYSWEVMVVLSNIYIYISWENGIIHEMGIQFWTNRYDGNTIFSSSFGHTFLTWAAWPAGDVRDVSNGEEVWSSKAGYWMPL